MRTLLCIATRRVPIGPSLAALILFWLSAAAVLPAASSRPSAVAVADFNGDGKPDVAATVRGESAVRIFLSGGKTLNVPLEAPPVALAVGDVNGDGKADLVVAAPPYVVVLLSRGDGTFQEPAKYDAGDSPMSVAVGDVDGDGRADILVLGERTRQVMVLLSDAGGGVRTAASFAAGVSPVAIAVGDFNSDGRLDLVVADAGTDQLLMLTGNGDGTFQAGGSYPAGPMPRSIAAGDFNGDGLTDVAVAGADEGKISLLLGSRGGALTQGEPFAAGPGWNAMTAADLEGKGATDLVTVNAGTGRLMTLSGEGKSFTKRYEGPLSAVPLTSAGGTATVPTLTILPASTIIFGHAVTLSVSMSPSAATGKITFYNGATILGVRTLVSGSASLNTTLLPPGNQQVLVYYGGDATYASSSATSTVPVVTFAAGGLAPAAGSPFPASFNPNGMAIGDVNGDGKPDLAIANLNGNNVTVLLGNGSGGFTASGGSPFAVGNGPTSVAIGDFNGDGQMDLAVTNASDNTVSVLLGNGSGGFTAAAGSPFAVGSSPNFVVVGDFNKDGKADLAVANGGSNNVTVMLGNGTGGFSAPPGSPFASGGSDPIFMAVADVNGDGIPDLAVVGLNSNRVAVLLGSVNGSFSPASGSPFTTGNAPTSVTIADFNGDGKLDLAVANSGTNNVTLLLGNGTGGFSPASGSPFAGGSQPVGIASLDFNGDGKMDLAITGGLGNNVTVLLGNGSGGFTPASGSPFSAGNAPVAIAVADFNQDGRTDVATANNGSNDVTVLLGTPPAAMATTTTLTPSPNPSTLGHAVTLTAIVSPSSATGRVTFFDGTTVLGDAPVSSGTAALSSIQLPSGTRSLRAYYGGDAGDLASTSATVSQVVNAVAGGTFTPTSAIAGGASPWALAIGDLNGDGKADIAIADSGNSVTVLLGNGSGGFTAASGSPFTAGSSPYSIAIGDFNNDGKPDLAIANSSSGNVTVLLGNGTGGFTAAAGSPFAAGTSPRGLAIGDFNGDGKPDLAITNSASNNVTVLLGNGAGGFTAATGSPFAVGSQPFTIAIGDFNGDGKADMAVGNNGDNTVTVLLGNGTGGFTAATGSPFAAGTGPRAILAADLNGDGKTDLAIANNGSNNVTVLLGNGLGGFTPATGSPFAAGAGPTSIATGDFNGDGKPDLAFTDFSAGANNVTVLLGNGTGSFTPASGSPYAGGGTAIFVGVGDFNGDGRADLAIADWASNSVTVLLGAVPANATTTTLGAAPNPATFGQTVTLTATVSPSAATGLVTFYDGTQLLGEAVVSSGTAVLTTFALPVGTSNLRAYYSGDAGDAASTSANVSATVNAVAASTLTAVAGSPFTTGAYPQSVAIGDFNGDGKADLAIANDGTQSVTVLLGNGSGSFTAATGSPLSIGSEAAAVVVGDFNGDGKADLAVAGNVSGTVSVYLGNGSGGFTLAAGSPYATGTNSQYLATGDFNGDGKLDLAIANRDSNNVTVLLGNGSGGFTAAPGSPFAAGTSPSTIVVADFNGDGIPDLATANLNSANITVLLGTGTGGFTAAPGSPFAAGSGPVGLAVGDFNGDGKADLAITNVFGANTVTVLLGTGTGGFTTASGSPFAAGNGPTSVAVLDFNGDGKSDLAITDANDNAVTILLGNGSGGFTPAPGSEFSAGSGAYAVAVGDFNGDGRADLAVANRNGSDISVFLGSLLPPTADSVTPMSGSGASQSFTFKYSSGGGFGYLSDVYALFNSTVNGANGCVVVYDKGSGGFYLFNDTGNGQSGPLVPGAGSLSNSQCTLNGTGSSVGGTANTLTVVLNLSFNPAFGGGQNIYMYAADAGGMASGWQNRGSWTVPAASTPPTADSVTPNTGSGTTQSFTFKYSSANGSSYLTDVYALFRTTISGANACFVYYDKNTGGFYLDNDSGTGRYGPLTPGSGSSLSNSQCTLTGTGSSVSGSGNTLSMVLNLTFNSSFGGNQNIFMYAADIGGMNSGWQNRGSWTVPAASTPPTADSVSPNSGSGGSQAFTFKYSSVNGSGYLNDVYALFKNTISGANACFVFYDRSAGGFYLFSDSGTALSGPLAPGAGSSLSNSQCTLAGTGSSVTGAGNTLTMVLNLSFNPVFGGTQNIYMYAADNGGMNSGWQNRGTWTVPAAATPPTADSASPNTGSGASQSFTFQYSSVNGSGYLADVYALFQQTVNGSNACFAFYDRASGGFYLFNDAGSGITGPLAPGTGSSLTNSQCTLNGTGSSVSGAGNALTVVMNLSFNPAFGGLQNIYMYAADNGGMNSGWQNRGSWTVPAAATPPTADSVSPNSGSGASQSFTLQYSSVNGPAYLADVYALFQQTVNATAACFVVYDRASGGFYLYNDAGSGITGPLVPGSGSSLSNSQCTLNGTGSSVSGAGATMTVVMNLSFNHSFSGFQNIFMYAADKAGMNSGWQTRGNWTVP